MPDIDGVNLRITADASSAEKEITKLTKATDGLKDATQNIEVKVDGKMDSLGKLHKANGQFMTMGEKMAEQFNSGFIKKFANIAPSFDKWGKNIANVTGKIDKYINRSVIAVTTTLGYFTKNVLSLGGGFEAQMTNVKIISSATTEELDALIKKAREMGATLPITAKDAAQAMELLAQRGTKAKDILATVADVSALAISQQIDMATSADLLGTTMTNFGLSVNDASRITDIFNNASNQSAMNISKLVAAMKYVGPAAGSLEIPLEKTVALMEAAANAGLTGEMIGTGLSMVFTKIATNAHIMGVATRNLDGSLREMSDIFSDLAEKGMDAGKANSFFGARAGKTAIALIKNAGQLKQNEINLQKWGATQSAVTEKMKTWPNVWNAFKSATEELHIEIFDQIKTQSKEAVSGMAELTRTFSNWVNETQLAGKLFDGFLQGIGLDKLKGLDLKGLLNRLDIDSIVRKFESLGYFFKYTANSIKTFYSIIRVPLLFLLDHLALFSAINFGTWIVSKGMSISTTIVKIAGVFGKLYEAIKAITAAKILKGLSTLWGLLTSPATLTIAGITAVSAGIYAAAKKITDAQKVILDTQKQLQHSKFMQGLTDREIELHFDLNVKTGFEDFEELKHGSLELQKKLLPSLEGKREIFSKKYYIEAIDALKVKIPELADTFEELKEAGDSVFYHLSQALHGNEREFELLSEPLQLVVEEIYNATKITGKYNVALEKMFENARKVREEAKRMSPEKIASTFREDISSGLSDMFLNFKTNLREFQEFLGDNSFRFSLNIGIDEFVKQIDKSVKEISEKFNKPEAIVRQGFINNLKEYEKQGSNVASMVLNRMKGVNDEINNFLNRASDYVEYLNVSPNKFLPAFDSIIKGMKKIDDATGEVTEEFKQAYNARKKFMSLSFDRFSSRIQDMKKAVERGSIDQSAIEKEFETALAHVSVKVNADMEPTKKDYRNERDYYGVFASKVVEEMYNIGGDIFGERLKSKYAGMTGESMGRAWVAAVKKDFKDQVVMKVDGIDKLDKFAIDTQQIKDVFNPFAQEIQNVDFKAPVQEITSALNSFNNKISNISVNVPTQDFSNAFNPVINKLNNLEVKLNSQEFVQAINSLISKLDNIQVKIVSQELQNNINVAIDTQQINSSLEAFATRLENIDLQVQGQTQIKDYSEIISQVITEIRTLNSSVGAVENAVRAINISVPASNNEAVNIDLSSVISAIQNNSNLSSQIISAINGLNIPGETNNYNIDIQQTGFTIQRKSDADSLARSTATAIQVGLGNGGV